MESKKQKLDNSPKKMMKMFYDEAFFDNETLYSQDEKHDAIIKDFDEYILDLRFKFKDTSSEFFKEMVEGVKVSYPNNEERRCYSKFTFKKLSSEGVLGRFAEEAVLLPETGGFKSIENALKRFVDNVDIYKSMPDIEEVPKDLLLRLEIAETFLRMIPVAPAAPSKAE